jgi:hypothetical protein
MVNPLDHVATLERVSVGMWVFSSLSGWVQVSQIDNGSHDGLYPIKAGRDIYTINGWFRADCKYPSLFLIDIFEGTSPPVPEVDWGKVPPGTPVIGDNGDGKGVSGLFAGVEWMGSAPEFRVWAQNTYYRFEHCRLVNAQEGEG